MRKTIAANDGEAPWQLGTMSAGWNALRHKMRRPFPAGVVRGEQAAQTDTDRPINQHTDITS
jgi:hypothetical protein